MSTKPWGDDPAAGVDRLGRLAGQAGIVGAGAALYRDDAIAVTLDHLSAAFIDTMAAEFNNEDTLAEQAAAAAVLTSAHRRRIGRRATDDQSGCASEWIARLLFSFELLPPMRVNLDSARAVRRFVGDHMVAGLKGENPD